MSALNDRATALLRKPVKIAKSPADLTGIFGGRKPADYTKLKNIGVLKVPLSRVHPGNR